MKNSKIKIIHLVSDLGIGGVQKVVLDICDTADLNKYDISIYCLNNKTELVPTYSLSSAIKIKTFSYTYSEKYSIFEYIKYTFFKRILLKKATPIIDSIINEEPDILHVHLNAKELNIGILVAKQIKCQLIYTQHLVRFNHSSLGLRLLAFILRYVYRKYHLVAVSNSVFDELNLYNLIGKNKSLTLIENKLNLNKYKPQLKKIKEYTAVVYVARIGYPKGHAELINAWSKLQMEPTRKKLILVGPDEMNNQIQDLARNLVHDDSVVFMGPRLDIAEILTECDFAVFPSFKEGLPIALLEKMAMELPVIISDIPELMEIVQDSFNGLTFKCGDPDSLAEKITILLQNRELRIRLGQNARKTVIDRFGSENIALPNEKVYEMVMKCV
jgi:glycosyltransferase involved in cell wall biosynthesis